MSPHSQLALKHVNTIILPILSLCLLSQIRSVGTSRQSVLDSLLEPVQAAAHIHKRAAQQQPLAHLPQSLHMRSETAVTFLCQGFTIFPVSEEYRGNCYQKCARGL